MSFEAALSVATLAALLWGIGVLLPKAVKERSGFALICAVLCVILAFIAWFLLGAKSVRS